MTSFDSARALYRFALDHPDWSEATVMECSGLTSAEVKAAVSTLLNVGLLQECAEARSGTRAVATATALSRLVDAGRATAELHRNRLEFLSAAVPFVAQEAIASAQVGRAPVEAEIVTGADRIAIAMDHCAAAATDEVLSLHPERSPALAFWQRIEQRHRATAQRGVTTRCVHRTGESEQSRRRLADLLAAGVEVRTMPVVPFQLLVVDARLAVVPHPTAGGAERALIIDCTGVAGVLRRVFEHYWQVAGPAAGASGGETQATAYRRTILNLMAGGLKDESIAREMGVSVRTLRRQVAELMDELGLRTRFQLGAHAQATAWINRTPERMSSVA